MTIDHWLAFVTASIILLAIPGPTVLLIISYALGHGRRPAAAIVAGVALGDITSMTTSMLGLGAVLAASAVIFTALRWIGGAYLVYLGVKLWRAPVTEVVDADAPQTSLKRIFAHSYAVTALNPKGIVFFIAFVPQFLSASASFLPQVAILEATFVALAVINSSLYAIMASAARQRLHKARVRRAVNRSGGTLLIGAGALAVGLRPAAL